MSNEHHYKFSDEELVDHFEKAKLKPEWFTHEAHVRLAWIYTRTYNLEESTLIFSRDLKRLHQKNNGGAKYNITITVLMMEAVYSRVEENRKFTFEQFKVSNQDIFVNCKAFIRQHYISDIFSNPEAQKTYIEPDIKPNR